MRLRHRLPGLALAALTGFGLAAAAPAEAPSQDALKVLIREGRYSEAGALGEEMLAKAPPDPGARLDLLDLTTEALWRGGKTAEAVARAREAQGLAERGRPPRR